MKAIKFISWLLVVVGFSLLLLTASYLFLVRSGKIERSLPALEGIAQVSAIVESQISKNLAKASDEPVPILMYHYIREVDSTSDPVGYGLSVTPEVFAEQLDALGRAGYHTITAQDFLSGNYPEKSIILTFDDGYRDFYTEARPVLKAHNMTAVVFVIYGFVGEDNYLTDDQIKQLVSDGFEIGSHSVSHPNLTSLSDIRLQQELMESRTALERLTGRRIVSISYPAGEYDDRVVRYADFVGYKLGVTVDNGLVTTTSEKLKLPRIRVTGNESADSLLAKLKS